ncbi:MAG: S-methyl-5-thioribose-1-phosphate isomerase [Deltaproteobacteria bacterium RBG_16_71_12]|nr:MAG: S-methyl-5-thioribose-1-phosphate isomerase [Deltaproteobacteria bacterium RBG_16_71_12]
MLVRDGLRPFFLDARGLHLLDQRALPHEERWQLFTDVEQVAAAIETLAVRGAPAIGGAAALGMVLAARAGLDLASADARLRKTRPTAKNLFGALDEVKAAWSTASPDARLAAVVDAAERHVLADEAACAAMGTHGAELVKDGDVVITICHSGALATCGQGTGLGVIKSARAQGKQVRVIALETRPLLQGARLTAWECLREHIPCTLITDGMSAFAVERLGVTRAVVGADRIARDGSTANKIGTRTLATVCAAARVPFHVAAPLSTFDRSLASGADIPIEERAADEVRSARGMPLAPADVPVWNPSFDVTPPALVTSFITERGVLTPPF